MRGEGPEREWDRDDLDPKTVVLGVTPADSGALGFPFPVVEATVGATDVAVLAIGDSATWTPATGGRDDGRGSGGYRLAASTRPCGRATTGPTRSTSINLFPRISARSPRRAPHPSHRDRERPLGFRRRDARSPLNGDPNR